MKDETAERALMLVNDDIHVSSLTFTTLDQAFRFLVVPKNPVYEIRGLWRLIDFLGNQSTEMLTKLGYYNSPLVCLVETQGDVGDIRFLIAETRIEVALWMEWNADCIPLLLNAESYYSICNKQIEMMGKFYSRPDEVIIRGVDAEGRLCSAVFVDECGEYCRLNRPNLAKVHN